MQFLNIKVQYDIFYKGKFILQTDFELESEKSVSYLYCRAADTGPCHGNFITGNNEVWFWSNIASMQDLD